MAYFIYFIFIATALLLLLDLLIFYAPTSKLVILPVKYKLNTNEIKFEFKIINRSKKKETMVPSLDIKLASLDNENLLEIDFEKEITIYDGKIKQDLKNYWKTIIVKSNSTINVSLIIKPKDQILENKSIWLRVDWSNYGHFGLINKQNYFLLNRCIEASKIRKLKKLKLNNNYEVITIKTDTLGIFNEPLLTISDYCKNIVKKGDILVIGETPLAIMQGKYINPQNINYSTFAKIFCYFFNPTSSLATACGMQLLINKIGITRIVYALIIGSFFKIFGIKGFFYRLTGKESSLIDDISGTTFPYDKTIVMGPINTKSFCNALAKILNIDVAIADVNDLGKVKVIATSNKETIKVLKRSLKGNPAGNADQKTPIVLIRKS